MKKAEVQIGGVYVAKISGKLTTVRLDSECPFGGWFATNIATGRQVRIRSAAKLRGPANAASGDRPGPAGLKARFAGLVEDE